MGRVREFCLRQRAFLLIATVVVIAPSGCGKKNLAKESKPEPVGITFKASKGLRITKETKKIIGLEILEASEQKMSAQFSTGLQVYHDTEGKAAATGFVTAEQAKLLKPGQSVSLMMSENAETRVEGILTELHPLAKSGQTEVLIEIPDAPARWKIGTTFEAIFTAQEEQGVTAIPRSAVLKTASGTFAYVVNGDYFFRTAIKTGAENADFVEVKDGLYAGDQIVRKPVMTLWIAELQAIKGGADND